MTRKFKSIDDALRKAAEIICVGYDELKRKKPKETFLRFGSDYKNIFLYTLDSTIRERGKGYRIAISKFKPHLLWLQYTNHSFKIQ